MMLAISKESVLSLFRKESCIDLRKLAAHHGVDATNVVLSTVISDLERNGKIRRIGGKGHRATFALSTFEGG